MVQLTEKITTPVSRRPSGWRAGGTSSIGGIGGCGPFGPIGHSGWDGHWVPGGKSSGGAAFGSSGFGQGRTRPGGGGSVCSPRESVAFSGEFLTYSNKLAPTLNPRGSSESHRPR